MRNVLVNDILINTDSEQLFRVLWVSPQRSEVYIFNLAIQEMPILVHYDDLIKKLESGEFEFNSTDPFLILVNEEELKPKAKQARDDVWVIMESAVCNEPGIFQKKERVKIFNRVIETSGKPLKSLHRYLKLYWLCGKTKNAFLPKLNNCGGKGKERKSNEQKRGRPRIYSESHGKNVDEATKRIFEQTIKKHYLNRNEHTFTYVYKMMIKEHYTVFHSDEKGKMKAEQLSESEIPTIEQFRYWYNKKHNVRETITKRKGATKFELNHRAVTGKSDYGIMGPGATFQIDATVGDIHLVSRFNRADLIGRPVIYFVIDMFSRTVVGMYVGLEGPSWAGSMMALANTLSDKVKYCAEYGIEITDEEWCCHHIPSCVRADRGEMESKSVENFINTLNVRVENTTPYRGDLKGIVEQYFRTINLRAMEYLPGHIMPDMAERDGHDYRLDSKLDLYQLTKILIQVVLQYNNHHVLETFERTEDMIADDVIPIPINLWNWGVEHYGGSLRFAPEDKVKLCLMPTGEATVTVKGIRFKGLYYLCERAAKEYWFETARAKGSFKVSISYDPRNMNNIYIRESDGTVEICFLAEWQDKYVEKCLAEINYLHAKEKMENHKNKVKEMASESELTAAIESVISEAEEMARQTIVPKSKTERVKNIRENRKREKELNRHNEAFTLGDTTESHQNEIEISEQEPEISPVLAMIKEQLEERLNGEYEL